MGRGGAQYVWTRTPALVVCFTSYMSSSARRSTPSTVSGGVANEATPMLYEIGQRLLVARSSFGPMNVQLAIVGLERQGASGFGLVLVGFGEQDRELVTAESRRHVHTPQVSLQHPTHLPEHPVANLVPE